MRFPMQLANARLKHVKALLACGRQFRVRVACCCFWCSTRVLRQVTTADTVHPAYGSAVQRSCWPPALRSIAYRDGNRLVMRLPVVPVRSPFKACKPLLQPLVVLLRSQACAKAGDEMCCAMVGELRSAL